MTSTVALYAVTVADPSLPNTLQPKSSMHNLSYGCCYVHVYPSMNAALFDNNITE